jgi:hypothetical protein
MTQPFSSGQQSCDSRFNVHNSPPILLFLPPEQAWQQRQDLELFLVHPLFPLRVRIWVLEQITRWQSKGFKDTYCAGHCDPDTGMTESHIFENLVVKMFETHNIDFSKKYFSGKLEAGAGSKGNDVN